MIQFQSEQISRLTASNAEISTIVASLNTEKTRLDGLLKESTAAIRKQTDEKKVIVSQLEESNQSLSHSQKRVQDLQKKLDDNENSSKKLNEEMKKRLEENTNTIEGKTSLHHIQYKPISFIVI